MIYSDLHCDTVTSCFLKKESIITATGNINSFKSKQLGEHRQCFALFVPDGKRGKSAFSYFKNLVEFYEKERLKLEKTNIRPILTAENGALLEGEEKNIDYIYLKNVKMLTLTHNGENELACGADCASGGLKSFGKTVVKKMQEKGIIIDVSHLNEASFYDVAKLAVTPLVASHSNCYSLLGHRRNLKDEQLRLIIESGGLIGLCFHAPFLSVRGISNFEMIYRNIFHLISLGGEDNICFGSDFDGGEIVSELSSVHKVKNLYAYLKGRGIDETLLEKIFFRNAGRLFFDTK